MASSAVFAIVILYDLSATSLSEKHYDLHRCRGMDYLDSNIKKPLEKAIKAQVKAKLLSYDCLLEQAAGANFIKSKQHLSWDSIRPPVLRDAEEQRYEEVMNAGPLLGTERISNFVGTAVEQWKDYLAKLDDQDEMGGIIPQSVRLSRKFSRTSNVTLTRGEFARFSCFSLSYAEKLPKQLGSINDASGPGKGRKTSGTMVVQEIPQRTYIEIIPIKEAWTPIECHFAMISLAVLPLLIFLPLSLSAPKATVDLCKVKDPLFPEKKGPLLEAIREAKNEKTELVGFIANLT
ncbi:hypothetical protein RB195_005538 [Necator americanus]|uniref:SCP-like protein n=2 Tax=Necator americanus TaxID=51031 RepID=A0ABR1BRS5_NECAM